MKLKTKVYIFKYKKQHEYFIGEVAITNSIIFAVRLPFAATDERERESRRSN